MRQIYSLFDIYIKKLLMEPASTFPIQYKKIIKPSFRCQVCLSGQQDPSDYIITCELCRSAVHQSHYGSELLLNPIPETWHCQRCKKLLENSCLEIRCAFCPNTRGIMKQYFYEKKKIWLHPECAAWPYPTLFFANKKKQTLKKEKPKHDSIYFWVGDYNCNPNTCSVCHSDEGLVLKCKYYSCSQSFHATCGNKIGIIRDLQSMRIPGTNSYFPLYCQQHIEKRINDYKKRSETLHKEEKTEKALHFLKLSNLFSQQLHNLEVSKKIQKEDEEMIEKLIKFTDHRIENCEIVNRLEFDNSNSFHSEDSSDFLMYLEQNLLSESQRVHIRQNQQKVQSKERCQQQKSHSILNCSEMQIEEPNKNSTNNNDGPINLQIDNKPTKNRISAVNQQYLSDNSNLYMEDSQLGQFQQYYSKN